MGTWQAEAQGNVDEAFALVAAVYGADATTKAWMYVTAAIAKNSEAVEAYADRDRAAKLLMRKAKQSKIDLYRAQQTVARHETPMERIDELGPDARWVRLADGDHEEENA